MRSSITRSYEASMPARVPAFSRVSVQIPLIGRNSKECNGFVILERVYRFHIVVNKQHNICKGAALCAESEEGSAGSMVAPEGYTYAVAIYSIRSSHINKILRFLYHLVLKIMKAYHTRPNVTFSAGKHFQPCRASCSPRSLYH